MVFFWQPICLVQMKDYKVMNETGTMYTQSNKSNPWEIKFWKMKNCWGGNYASHAYCQRGGGPWWWCVLPSHCPSVAKVGQEYYRVYRHKKAAAVESILHWGATGETRKTSYYSFNASKDVSCDDHCSGGIQGVTNNSVFSVDGHLAHQRKWLITISQLQQFLANGMFYQW